ncbi:MAG: hypothetical protein ACFFEJ_02475 [Candidatus Thorarchaeota archaeon]
MTFTTSTNPDHLSKQEIVQLITSCPVCSTPWPKGKYECANEKCGVKLRVEPKALNWWMFYPPCNGWGHLSPS